MIVKEFLTITSYLKDIKVVAICGRKNSENTINDLKNKYNIDNAFYNYDELLNSDVDTIYIALPNNLHFEFAKKAIEVNKNVIFEKLITSIYKEALVLINLAKEKELFIFGSITNQYLSNYKKIKALLPKLGNIKIVRCKFSQYCSRYDKFKEGNILQYLTLSFHVEH